MKWKPGFLKTHEYTTFLLAPSIENTNDGVDALIKAFFSVRSEQLFKQLRGGQPVVAAEFFADHTTAYYLYSVPSLQRDLMRERMLAAFPGSGLKEQAQVPLVDNVDKMLITSIQLAKNPVMPINLSEPLGIYKDIQHVADELREGEQLFLQILMEPLDDGWQEELEHTYDSYLQGKALPGVSKIEDAVRSLDSSITKIGRSIAKEKEHEQGAYRKHRQIPDFHKKIRQLGFHVAVRVIAVADTYQRRNDISEGVMGAFKTTNYHNSWKAAPVLRKKAAWESIQHRQMPLVGINNLLCEDELKNLLRLPIKATKTLRLERMRPDEERVDQRITGGKIIPIGYSIEYGARGEAVGFNIDDPDTAAKARLWIAPPGSGKTTTVKLFMQGALAVGHGGSVFDIADGNLYLGCIEATAPQHREKLVLVDFANDRYPCVFNFSSLGQDSDTIANMFAEFFEIFFKTAANQRMNSFLRKAAVTTFVSPDSTFLELIMMMRDEDFRRAFLPKIRASHPDLFLWWKSEFPKIAKSESQMMEILQPILYRLDNIQYNKTLGPIFCGKGGGLQIGRWMNEGRWILYNISNGAFLENEQRMLMSFLNYAYWTATLSRERMLQGKIEPILHHKMYDEPQTYMTATPIFELSISKSRKYRVSDNFLIQNPTQVLEKDKALWSQIIGMNPHILVGGGLDNDGLKEMAGILKVTKEELAQLESLEYHWYMKTYVGKSVIKPFIFNAKGMVATTYGPAPALQAQWRTRLAPWTSEQQREHISARNLRLSVEEYRKLIASYSEEDEEGVPVGEDS